MMVLKWVLRSSLLGPWLLLGAAIVIVIRTNSLRKGLGSDLAVGGVTRDLRGPAMVRWLVRSRLRLPDAT